MLYTTDIAAISIFSRSYAEYDRLKILIAAMSVLYKIYGPILVCSIRSAIGTIISSVCLSVCDAVR